jgi:hypothetical protein
MIIHWSKLGIIIVEAGKKMGRAILQRKAN